MVLLIPSSPSSAHCVCHHPCLLPLRCALYSPQAKVKEFLDAAVQLAGMGFEARRVHDALLAAANDAAEAVDILSR